MREYFVYIVSSKSGTLYTGVTKNILSRVDQHKRKENPGFTERYNIDMLVYYESFSNINDAIAREKQIKRWRREKKVALITAMNPGWSDLSATWYE